ncbi:MAG: pilus assembly protein, partial [Dialister sp.]|nr:pilus assembly protein [Dialister sp.]
MKRQKGQDIVEFALLLPIFLLVLCGIIYCGFMFGDYQTVQGIVRNAAREAAVVGHYTESADPSQPKTDNYQIIEDKYNQILKEQ